MIAQLSSFQRTLFSRSTVQHDPAPRGVPLFNDISQLSVLLLYQLLVAHFRSRLAPLSAARLLGTVVVTSIQP